MHPRRPSCDSLASALWRLKQKRRNIRISAKFVRSVGTMYRCIDIALASNKGSAQRRSYRTPATQTVFDHPSSSLAKAAVRHPAACALSSPQHLTNPSTSQTRSTLSTALHCFRNRFFLGETQLGGGVLPIPIALSVICLSVALCILTKRCKIGL